MTTYNKRRVKSSKELRNENDLIKEIKEADSEIKELHRKKNDLKELKPNAITEINKKIKEKKIKGRSLLAELSKLKKAQIKNAKESEKLNLLIELVSKEEYKIDGNFFLLRAITKPPQSELFPYIALLLKSENPDQYKVFNALSRDTKREFFNHFKKNENEFASLIDRMFSNIFNPNITLNEKPNLSLKRFVYTDVKNRNLSLFEKVRGDRVLNKATKKHKKNLALSIIDKYIHSNPSAIKKSFFNDLKESIEKLGFSTKRIEHELLCFKTSNNGYSNPIKNLFNKWNGPLKSNAAKCLFELIELASGCQLSDEEKNHLVHYGNLKKWPADEAIDQLKVKDKIHAIAIKTFKSKATDSEKEIKDTLLIQKEIDSFSRLSENKTNRKNSNNKENKRIEIIVKKALGNASQENESYYLFDPQGHIITDIEIETRSGTSTKKETYFCDIDIIGHPKIQEQFKSKLKDLHLEEKKSEIEKSEKENGKFDSAFTAYINSPNRGSIIPLQQEAEMQLRLLLNIIKKGCQDYDKDAEKNGRMSIGINDETWEKIHHATGKKINLFVLSYFKEGLISSYRDKENSININELNQFLDKKGKEIANLCKKELVDSIYNQLSKNQEKIPSILTVIKDHLTESIVVSTPATEQTQLRTDNRNKIASLTSPTHTTAHAKQEIGGDKQAIRTVQHFHYTLEKKTSNQQKNTFNKQAKAINSDQPEINVQSLKRKTCEARVPAIAVIDIPHRKAVNDVADKLTYSRQNLDNTMPGYGGHMVYNLLISLRTKAYDGFTFGFYTPPGRKNRERLRAARILKGAHVFNERQVRKGEPFKLCYVQHMPVNQHGDKLSYNSFDSSHREAALMSDIALLATLTENKDLLLDSTLQKEIKNTYRQAHENYILFLKTHPQGDLYFNDTKEGKDVVQQMKSFSKLISDKLWNPDTTKETEAVNKKTETVDEKTEAVNKKIETVDEKTDAVNKNTSFPSLAATALIKIMGAKLGDYAHRDLQYGTLVQTLSVFLAPMKQSGCKSANERYGMVAGRVELLKSMELRDHSEYSSQEKELHNTLIKFNNCKDINDTTNQLRNLQKTLDLAYSEHNKYGSATGITGADQGSASKVKSESESKSSAGKVTSYNTNVAEPSWVNIFSGRAKSAQAHTGKHLENLLKIFKQKFSEVFKKTTQNSKETSSLNLTPE